MKQSAESGIGHRSFEEFQLRLAEPDEIRRRDGDWPVDGEDRDLELVAALDRGAQHDALGHVVPLNSRRAGIGANCDWIRIGARQYSFLSISTSFALGLRTEKVCEYLPKWLQVVSARPKRPLGPTSFNRIVSVTCS